MTERLTDEQLANIYQRLKTGLNDDGLRAWYPTDVRALLLEVYRLRTALTLAEMAPVYDTGPVRRPRGRPRKVRPGEESDSAVRRV